MWGHVGPSGQGEFLPLSLFPDSDKAQRLQQEEGNCQPLKPPSQSPNDQVSRDRFENRPFTLKFPKNEDIVDQILTTEDPMLFKIDVAGPFWNLRADPVDALKLGIC